jgi:hypothetical protein
VPFKLGREHGQSGKKEQPDGQPNRIQAAQPPGIRIEDRGCGYHAASIQQQKALRRQLEGGLVRPRADGAGSESDIRISNR